METIWTAAEWMAGADDVQGATYWRVADGRDHRIIVTEKDPQLVYALKGPQDGSITVEDEGRGSGEARRLGPGDGDAVRSGPGAGNAICNGAGNGHAVRENGPGNAVRDGSGDGDAIRRGSGDGYAIRRGAGYGEIRQADSFGRKVDTSITANQFSQMTPKQCVEIAIRCAHAVRFENSMRAWDLWYDKWMSGDDRSRQSAFRMSSIAAKEAQVDKDQIWSIEQRDEYKKMGPLSEMEQAQIASALAKERASAIAAALQWAIDNGNPYSFVKPGSRIGGDANKAVKYAWNAASQHEDDLDLPAIIRQVCGELDTTA